MMWLGTPKGQSVQRWRWGIAILVARIVPTPARRELRVYRAGA